MTSAEFERWANADHYELIDGVPREKMGGAFTSAVNAAFGRAIGRYVDVHRIGYVFDGTGPYQCFAGRPDTVRKPDVSFVRLDRFPDGRVPLGHCLFAPDLMVEVVARAERWGDVERKVDDFLGAGVALAWVVNPHLGTVHAYHPGGAVVRHRRGEELHGDPVLPGFRVRLADVLPKPRG